MNGRNFDLYDVLSKQSTEQLRQEAMVMPEVESTIAAPVGCTATGITHGIGHRGGRVTSVESRGYVPWLPRRGEFEVIGEEHHFAAFVSALRAVTQSVGQSPL